MTVGFGQVERKLKKWEDMSESVRLEAMTRVCVPGVRGPKESVYLTDHHHEALALQRLGAKTILVSVLADLRHFSQDDFWIYLDHRDWVHSYDVTGRRRPFDEMPELLKHMKDDPFRSLAAKVRQHGGFAKSDIPYLEFLWANYFRNNIKAQMLKKNPSGVFRKAMKLANAPSAECLPGFAAEN
jgi:hypothetical protein